MKSINTIKVIDTIMTFMFIWRMVLLLEHSLLSLDIAKQIPIVMCSPTVARARIFSGMPTTANTIRKRRPAWVCGVRWP